MFSVATATYFHAAAVPIQHSCGCNLVFVILINYPAQKMTFLSASPLAHEDEDSEKNHKNTFKWLNYAKEDVLFLKNDLDNRTMHINKLASLLFRNTNMKEKKIIYCILSDVQKLDANQRGHQRQFITSVPTAHWVISMGLTLLLVNSAHICIKTYKL